MIIFEAFLKNGSIIQGENWNEVPVKDVECLIVHHPWNPGLSVAFSGEGELFLYKEALGQPGKPGQMTAVGFGRRLRGEKQTIVFTCGGLTSERWDTI